MRLEAAERRVGVVLAFFLFLFALVILSRRRAAAQLVMV